MSDFLKPQSPLQHKDGAYIYPLTTVDQVILEDGNRLNTILDSIDADTLNGKIESELNVANANTLNGKLENELSVANANTLGGQSTASDITNLQNSIGNLKFVALTSNEYTALSIKDSNTLYIITD